MCNFNQVFRGKQRYHYSCCRRRMHQIVTAPCCSSGQNRETTEESIEMCWPRTCPEINGTAKIPAVEKTSTGAQLPRKSPSSTPKIPDHSKTNPLPKKISPTDRQKNSNNKLSDYSVSSTSKKLSKESPVQTNLNHKKARLSGGSIEIKKNKKSCICTSCEVNSLMSVCSSEPDYGSPMSMSSPKTSRKCNKMKPSKSKLEPQDTDLKALVRTKPKRKKVLQRRWPTRSPECDQKRLDESNTQLTNDDDGVWFECNLPLRVNIPFPISIRNLFSLQSFPNNACQGRAIVPARNGGNCLTMRNALPAPVPEPQPQPTKTIKKGCRRLKTRSSPSPSPSPSPNPGPCSYPCSCPCESSTQTGVEASDLLRCLYEIKNQLSAKTTECRSFAEKSTYVRTPEDQNTARKGAKRREEKPAKISKYSAEPSDLLNSSPSEVQTPTTKSKKTEKNPKQTKSCSSTNVSRNSSKSSLSEVPEPPTKTKNDGRTPKEPVSMSSKSSGSCFCSSTELPEPPINNNKSGEKLKKTTSTTPTTSASKKCSTLSFQDGEKNSQRKLEEKEKKMPHVKSSIIPKKPLETVESIKDLDMEKKHVSSDPDPEVENKRIEPQVEENKSKQIEREGERIDPSPPTAMAAPRVFPNEFGMCQGLGYQMYHGFNAGTPSMYQAPQYPGHCYQRSWPIWQRNAYLWNNTPQTECLYQSPCSPAATRVGSLRCMPLVEVMKCEEIETVPCPCLPTATRVESMPCGPLAEVMKCEQNEPVKKPSVGFCQRPQVFSEYSYPTTQGSQCQSSCMQQTPGHCSQRCGQNWTIPISSSTEYNRKTLLKRALCRNASPIGSLSSRFPPTYPLGAGVRCNSKPSAKSICFRVCPSQPQSCNDNGNTYSGVAEKKCESKERSMTSLCRSNHQHLPPDRFSSGGETNGTEGSQCSSVSRELNSVSGSILEYKIEQEYYFPLTDKSQRSNRSSKKTSDYQHLGVDDQIKKNMSLNDEVVINVNIRQSKTREVCSSRRPTSHSIVNDNISYNQNKSRDGISEDQIIVNFTNRSFSINSEEFERSSSEEKQRISHKPPKGISTDEDLASYSETTFSRDHSFSESIRTYEEDDIDEAPSTSWKTVHKFESKQIYSKLSRQSSTERSALNQVSESLTTISYNSRERYSKQRPMTCTRHMSGMCKPSNLSEKQAKKQQKSPKVNTKKRSCSAPGCSGASVLRDGESRSKRPVIYRQYLSPRNQIPEKLFTLTQGSDNVQDASSDTELEHAKHIPSERIRKNDIRKDIDICKIPDYSLRASNKQAKQRTEARCFIPSKQLERTHQDESSGTELIRRNDNRKDLYEIPDYSLKASMMQAKQRSENRCFIASQQQERTHTVPRYIPDYQNTQHRSPRNADYQESRQNPPITVPRPIKNMNTRIDCQPDECFRTDPTSGELQTESDNSCQVPEIIEQTRRPPFQECLPSPCRQHKRSPHVPSPENKDIAKIRLRKPSSEEEYFNGYFARACKCRPHSSASKSSLSLQTKETQDIYPEHRNRSRFIHGKNTQIISCESELTNAESDSESAELSLLASKNESEYSRFVVCKPNNNIETLKTATLLQPRRLRCNESTTIWNPDMDTGNTVLLEIRTTCNKDNLLQTCARPPFNCHDRNARIPSTNVPVQSRNLPPENLHHPGYHPQQVREAINKLPIGFYDQTIQHYNVIRMDSDLQVPPFGPEVIQAVQAFPQPHCGCPACPYGNPIQQQMMSPVQDFNRPFFLPRNQIQQRLPTGPTPFCPSQSNYQC